MLNLNTRVQSAQPPAEPVDRQSRIARILKAIDELRVELRKLYEELENTGDPGKRMELRHRIDGIEEMIEALRRQIMMLTQLEQRRKADLHAKPEAGNTAAARAASAAPDGDGQTAGEDGGAGDGEPDLYYPPATPAARDD